MSEPWVEFIADAVLALPEFAEQATAIERVRALAEKLRSRPEYAMTWDNAATSIETALAAD